MNQILKFENTKQQITIDKDTCDDIRVADINFQSQKSVIINLLETHAMNLKDTLTQTVVYGICKTADRKRRGILLLL